MAGRKDLIKAAITNQTPTVQQANPVRPPPRTKADMTLEEFMRRNPSARSKDKVKTAQENQGKRSGPKTRPTARSRRGGNAVPADTGDVDRIVAAAVDMNKWNVNQINVAGDQVDFLTPTNPGLGAGPTGGRPGPAEQSYGGPGAQFWRDTKGLTSDEFSDAYDAEYARGSKAHKQKAGTALFEENTKRLENTRRREESRRRRQQ